MKPEIKVACANCGVVLPPGVPDHAYPAIYRYDENGEPLYGMHCDKCGEELGIRRIDIALLRARERN